MQIIAEPPVTTAVAGPALDSFPPFSLARLLRTVFNPHDQERVCILIDLPDPHLMKDYAFLGDPKLTIQRIAYETFQQGLKNEVLAEMDLRAGEMFAYKITGGSNLDLPDLAVDAQGNELSLEKDIYTNYDLILCISTYSATAPLTAVAKQFGFRGATLHGVNPTILASGLAVDYDEVSHEAEKLRLGLTRADAVEIDFGYGDQTYCLTLEPRWTGGSKESRPLPWRSRRSKSPGRRGVLRTNWCPRTISNALRGWHHWPDERQRRIGD